MEAANQTPRDGDISYSALKNLESSCLHGENQNHLQNQAAV